MGAITTRVWKLLTSRRLAVALIGLIVVFTIIATLVPQGRADDPKIVAWRAAHPVPAALLGSLGFHTAFTSPIFLALALLLALCTGACAIERTRRAVRLVRAMGSLPRPAKERLSTRPHFAIDVAECRDENEVMDCSLAALRALGLRAQRRGVVAEAQSGRWGLLGSPLFHWAIVALMLTVAIGQATRAEGLLALPLGQRVTDAKTSYMRVAEGPLFAGRYTGLDLTAKALDRNHWVGGINRGPAPFITVSRAGEEVASGYVYPNKPLSVGPLMVHMVDFGPVATMSLESSAGIELARDGVLIDRGSEASSGAKVAEVGLSTRPGTPPMTVRIQIHTYAEPSEAAPASTASIEIAQGGSRVFGRPVDLTEGQAMTLPSGERLRLADVDDWVLVSVADDWSVPVIYALLAAAVLALAIATLVPARRVALTLIDTGDSRWLHGITWCSSSDPTFASRVEHAVRTAVKEEPDGTR